MPLGVYERTEYHKSILRGIKRSLMGRQNISKALIGRKLSKEHCQNISKSLTGVKFSEERCQNISEGGKKYFTKITKEEKLKRTLPMTIASQKANPSFIEKLVWKELDKLGIIYETQVFICGSWFVVDIYIPIWRLIIECNGTYWHNYEIFSKQKIRDNAVDKWALRNGYKIIWLWESDIRRDPKSVLLKVLKRQGVIL